MISNPAHIVGIIGGAVSGSEAAKRLADRGIIVVVFDMKSRPYGKIEDGLPIWHTRLREKYINQIDANLSHPNIHFLPGIKIGKDISFKELINNWDFSSILLANGAWKDRPLNIKNADDYLGKGLLYQNSLVAWFNRSFNNEKIENYDLPDNIMVIGGGLASLDVVKIIMLKTVHEALRKRNIEVNIFELEHKSIRTILSLKGISLQDLGLNGCTLFYRKREQDMPLATMPTEMTKKKREVVYNTRLKILNNFQGKYLFNVKSCHIPTDIITENDWLVGLKFKKTISENGNFEILDETEYSVYASLIVSSIGSIPEPIRGIPMTGELYNIKDNNSGRLKDFENVFALGNVVTGKGNIRTSIVHGQQVSDHVMDYYLAWKEEDYNELLKMGSTDAKVKSDQISKYLTTRELKSKQQIQAVIGKVKSIQERA